VADINIQDDKVLVAEFLKGNVRSFDLLHEKYSERLYGFTFKLLKNKEDALDIVQETFLKIWQKRRELDEDKSFKSFLFTISYNIIMDQLRKRLNDNNYLEFLKQNFKLEQSISENEADFNILEKQIQSFIGQLPLRRQEIYRMSREKGYSNNEIAEKLSISVKTVETQINLAVKFMKSRLTDGSLPAILFFALFY
jgi:RNA polymerase sigma-70 factor (ECF subfamily)